MKTVIKPGKRIVDLKEIWGYRELLLTLATKEIKVRYKQTLIGGLWAILQPFLTMVVFTIFFGKVANMPSDDIPYAIFSYSGLVLWIYFRNAVSSASQSTITNAPLITKIYFPRIIIPLASTLYGILDYVIAFIIIFGMMFYYKFSITPWILLVPVILFFTWLLASGAGFWLSAINVKYRDVRYIVPFFIQLLLFVTPVIYPVSLAGRYKWLLALNPMSGLIEAHRALVLAHHPVDWMLLSVSACLTVIIFVTGMLYFRSVERYFADVI